MVGLLNKRRQVILSNLIEGYIKTASPISSAFLAKMGSFDFSPATIRNEFSELTNEGYLEQPHTSAGRIPTIKGYRYYVNELMEPKKIDRSLDKALSSIISKHFKDTSHLFYSLTNFVTQTSHNLVFTEMVEASQNTMLGLLELFNQPEFKEHQNLKQVAKVIDRLEQDWQLFYEKLEETDGSSSIIFVGGEEPLFEKSVSSIAARYNLPSGQTVMMMIIGPSRMNYSFNVSLLNRINDIIEG